VVQGNQTVHEVLLHPRNLEIQGLLLTQFFLLLLGNLAILVVLEILVDLVDLDSH
jgi:hypothetical protein